MRRHAELPLKPLCRQKPTSPNTVVMYAKCQGATKCAAAKESLLDHFVGGLKKRRRTLGKGDNKNNFEVVPISAIRVNYKDQQVSKRHEPDGACLNRPAEGDVWAAMSAIAQNEPVVFVVDDSADVREGLKALFESVGLECKVFNSPKEFLRSAPESGPSCLILDVRLPEMSGLDVQTELARASRDIPTVVISGYGDIPMAVRAMRAGAISFLTKPVSEQDLLDAVYTGIEKDRERLSNELKARDLRARYHGLNAREREIFPLITAGLLNKQVATEIGLSEITVKVHRHKLMAKLNAKRLPDLVRMADELGITRRRY